MYVVCMYVYSMCMYIYILTLGYIHIPHAYIRAYTMYTYVPTYICTYVHGSFHSIPYVAEGTFRDTYLVTVS